jgi:hypothetical protein
VIRPRLPPTLRKRWRAALVVLLVGQMGAALGGVADAYWTGSGSGTGSGTTGITVAITLAPGSPAATLYPGGQADVVIVASNPNTSAIHIGDLALDASGGSGGLDVDADHSGCATSALSFSTQTNDGAGWTVPAKAEGVDGTLAVTLTHALSMSAGAANACQGARFTVYLTAGS